MNKICKEYISEIKALFPIKRKPEKDYIKKIAADVADYCEEANVTSKQELYDNYGRPNDVVNNYFATVDTEYIVKQISTKRLLKNFLVIMLVLATIATSVLCMILCVENRIYKELDGPFYIETTIIEHN